MAYGLDHIEAVETWTAADELGDDIALDIDVTVCMTNGTEGDECDEWKEGTLNCRVEIGIPPSAVTALKIRFYFTTAHTDGTNSLYPYTDANSVSGTNAVNMDYTSVEEGAWVEHIVDGAFLAELGDLGDKFAVRLASPDSAKSKLGEVNIDITFTPDVLTGVTKDKNGDVLVSCKVALFKVTDEGPPEEYEWIASTTSDGVTGAYSFDVWAGNTYMVYAEKDDSPHVFDCSDNVLEADV